MIDRLFIVGKGSSLKGFDFSRLDNEFTIALNGAFEWFTPKAVFFLDRRFLERYREQMKGFNGIIYAGDQSGYDGETIEFKAGYRKLSGIAAIQLALKLADKIYLLGYDMNVQGDGESPYAYPFGEDVIDGEHVAMMYSKAGWIQHKLFMFDSYFSPYKDRVFNCNPNSSIKTFDFVDIDEVLSG